ncbi:MAG TPA: hypothetical protein VGM06_01855 [Polyangiaceae bacterium]|jgi:hypothetical protein
MTCEKAMTLLGPTLTGVIVSGLWAWLTQRGRFAFEKRMEDDRRIAQRALAALETELTFNAEVRRQAASKKVAALFRFIELGNTLISKVLWPVFEENGLATEALNRSALAVKEYRGALLEDEALFDHEARQQIADFVTEVEAARDVYRQERKEGRGRKDVASARADVARATFFQMLRRELQIETGQKAKLK